jgi:hypothetical protein
MPHLMHMQPPPQPVRWALACMLVCKPAACAATWVHTHERQVTVFSFLSHVCER